jgi:hypothetical protein
LARGFGWSIGLLLGVALVLVPALFVLALARRSAVAAAGAGRREEG